MMVKYTRQIFDVSDLKAIRIQCVKCGIEVLQEPTKFKMVDRCAGCGAEWKDDDGSPDPNRTLLQAIRCILRDDGLPVTIRFEIEPED